MAKYRCFNIIWDTDGQDIDIPQSIVVEVDEEDDKEIQEQGDINGILADKLSDKTGWCVWSYEYEKVERVKTS